MKRLDLSSEERAAHLKRLHSARNKRYAATPSARDKKRARMRKWRAANSERCIEYSRRGNERMAGQPERCRAYGRKTSARYRIRHPDKVRALMAGRSVVAVAGTLEPDDLFSLWDAQDGRCAYCVLPLDRFEIEHVVPLKLKGLHQVSNVVLSCRTCNRRKGARTWIPSIGHLANEADAIALLEYARAELVPAS